ncbi:MAG: hypothetical protein C0501_24610 [Isosphaera sp.]|nr:hypothetical protein [Isosphaera sp.]
MDARSRARLPAVVAASLAVLPAAPARGDSWIPRTDIGVAAVDTRTGRVLWEAWRPDEIPPGASGEVKAAAEALLPDAGKRRLGATELPEVPVKDLGFENPWPDRRVYEPLPVANRGKSLIYYRHPRAVIALDPKTKTEAWRLPTESYREKSDVAEAGDNTVLIQIGSAVPATLQTVLLADPKQLRMRGLEPHTARQRLAAAVFLHHYGDGYLRPELKKVAGKLRADKDDPDAGPAAKSIDKLLATWPPKRDHRRLLDGSVATLTGADGDPFREFAWPGAQRLLAWSLLQEQIYGGSRDAYSRQGDNYAYDGWDEKPVPLDDATKAKLVEHCKRIVAPGPDGEKPFAASVLVSTAVGWGRLTDAERKDLFLSAQPSAWRWAAVGLVKNGRREQLMEWARERPAGDHLDVCWLLKRDKPKGWVEKELAFWVATARHDAAGVATALGRTDGPIPVAFREPIRAYLQKEIAKPTVMEGGTLAAYSLHDALSVLGGFKNPDDTPLLLEYLKHPMSGTLLHVSGERRWQTREYRARGTAAGLLTERGVAVPPGVVYSEDLGPVKE